MAMFNRSYVSCELIGYLGAEPKALTTKNGKSMATFTVAITTSAKDEQGNWVNNTQWISCAAFGGFADRAIKALHKGSMVLVKGEPQIRQYQKKDGSQATLLEILVNDLVVLSSPKRDEVSKQPTSNTRPAPVQTRETAVRDAFASEQQDYDFGTEAF